MVRDYQFEEAGDEQCFHQSIHSCGHQSDAFLSTDNIFTSSNSFMSWKHWRKIDLRLHRQRSSPNHIPPSERVVGPYFLRAGSMWQKIEQWCDDEERSGALGREIKSSFSPGRTLDPNANGRVPTAEVSALKAVYAFYAGQRDPMMDAPAAQAHRFNPFSGLFGGFQAYHFLSNTRWMEPNEIVETQYLVIAQDAETKTMAMDLVTGQIYSSPDDDSNKFVATPCAGGIHRSRDDWGMLQEKPANPFDSKDSILRWFEEHARRLHQNFYSIGSIVLPHVADEFISLLRYPTVADTTNCSCTVTRGIEIVVSAIFVPEMSAFIYSIRLRLLTPEDGEGYMSPEQRGFDTCQLVSRYWKISKSSPNLAVEVEEVRGDGVIGLYPLLYEGGYTNFDEGGDQVGYGRGVFSYQSCTQADKPGFMEGDLQFRPGSLAEPSGQIFNARVDPFPLEFSQYIY